MKKLLDWMESSFTPMMNKINHNVWVITLKDSINQTMPLIFLGSIFSLLSIPGSAFGWEWWPQFGQLTNWTMGLISLMMAFLIPFNFMEKSRLRKSRIIAGISGVILFASASRRACRPMRQSALPIAPSARAECLQPSSAALSRA